MTTSSTPEPKRSATNFECAVAYGAYAIFVLFSLQVFLSLILPVFFASDAEQWQKFARWQQISVNAFVFGCQIPTLVFVYQLINKRLSEDSNK